jgi:hypothetical protein
MNGETLVQVNALVYVLNGMLLAFFTSQYTISLAGRSLMYVNNINMVFRRWSADQAAILPMVFNLFLVVTIFECHSYIMNEEKVKLFLAKDFSEKQEQQTRAILQNIPTNVMVVSESQLKFKNKHADKLLDDFSKGINNARDESLDQNFYHSDFMLKAQIFRPELKKLSENSPLTLQTQQSMPNNVSLALILEDSSILKVCDRFLVALDDGSTRIFTIMNDSITLNNESCSMLLLQE